MPDWVGYVGRRLKLPGIDPARERRRIEEVAQQLEEFYREALADGASEADAAGRTRRQIPDWAAFSREIADAEARHRLPALDRWADSGAPDPDGARAGRLGRWAGDLKRDVVVGIRLLTRNPGFAAAAVLTLALGIGANTITFAVVEALLLRPLPFPRPAQLVAMWEVDTDGDRRSPAFANIEIWRERSEVLSDAAGMIAQSAALTGDFEPTRVRAGFVTEGFFNVAGVDAAHGRTFRSGDDALGTEPVAVLQNGLWETKFGADPQIVGRRIELNGDSFTVVGIMPRDFDFPVDDVEVWLPMSWVTQDTERAWWGFGRLSGGATLAAAESRLTALTPTLLAEAPELNEALAGVRLQSLHEMLVADARPMLRLFLGAVALVLLIACSNVANLLLARGAARERDVAVRAALGAGRVRIVRQLLTETLVLAGAGAAVGLLLAVWGVRVMNVAMEAIFDGRPAELNPAVLAFTVGVTLLTALLFGLAPTLQLATRDLVGALNEGGRGAGHGSRFRLLTDGFVVLQIGLAVVLLVGAALLVRSLTQLLDIQPGYRTANLLTLEYRLSESDYPDERSQYAFHGQAIERIRQIPGVESAALVRRIPFSYNRAFERFSLPDLPELEGDPPFAFVNVVGTDAFRTLGVPLIAGRPFAEEDARGALRIVINETMARRYWGEESPIGARVRFDGMGAEATVIGVVGDVRYLALDEERWNQVYGFMAQVPGSFTSMAIRTSGDPLGYAEPIRRAIWSVDADQPVWKLRTAASMLDSSLAQRRLTMRVLLVFAVAALLLAAIGVYGVTAYSVSRQTHEMAVRLAFGATRGALIGLVLRRGLGLAGLGVVLGIAGALAGGRLIASMLVDVTPTDPLTLLLVSIVAVTVALAACFAPAHRATRIDPTTALTVE